MRVCALFALAALLVSALGVGWFAVLLAPGAPAPRGQGPGSGGQAADGEQPQAAPLGLRGLPAPRPALRLGYAADGEQAPDWALLDLVFEDASGARQRVAIPLEGPAPRAEPGSGGSAAFVLAERWNRALAGTGAPKGSAVEARGALGPGPLATFEATSSDLLLRPRTDRSGPFHGAAIRCFRIAQGDPGATASFESLLGAALGEIAFVGGISGFAAGTTGSELFVRAGPAFAGVLLEPGMDLGEVLDAVRRELRSQGAHVWRDPTRGRLWVWLDETDPRLTVRCTDDTLRYEAAVRFP